MSVLPYLLLPQKFNGHALPEPALALLRPLQDYYQSSTSVLHLLTLNEFRANPALLLTLHMDTFLRVRDDEGVGHTSLLSPPWDRISAR